jgi:toxin ParE1/3/4
MPLDIEYARRARIDLQDIWKFVANDNRRAATELLNHFGDIFTNLASNPMIGRSREELGAGVRSFPYGRYLIFYQPNDKTVAILRVLSSYRDITPEMLQE